PASSAVVVLVDEPARAARAFPEGATIFAGACAGCHATGAPMLGQGRPALGLATNLREEDPTSAIQAVLRGIQPPVARRGALMPSFADGLTDTQVAVALSYARARFTDRPAWEKLDRKVATARKESAEP
ncbi:MAG: cytochrome C, partial [Oxalobacteraceae bacterium]